LVPQACRERLVTRDLLDLKAPQDSEETLDQLEKLESLEHLENLDHQEDLELWDPKVSKVPEGEEDRKVTGGKWVFQVGKETREKREKLVQRDLPDSLERKENLAQLVQLV